MTTYRVLCPTRPGLGFLNAPAEDSAAAALAWGVRFLTKPRAFRVTVVVTNPSNGDAVFKIVGRSADGTIDVREA